MNTSTATLTQRACDSLSRRSTAYKPTHAARATALAAALACSLFAAPAQAEDRYWTFIGGCGSADWFGTTGGPNAHGRFTCWSNGAFGGISGFPTPTAADDVFVLAPGATSTLLVSVVLPNRPPFSAAARDVYVQGSTSFAAGLNIDRNSAAFRNLMVGAEGSPGLIGRVDQSAGSVSIGNSLVLRAGDYKLSGGSLLTGSVVVRSQAAAAHYNQTGGTLVAGGGIDIRSEFGRDASFSVLAGSVTGSALTLGGALGAGSSVATVSGFGTVWNTTGATMVGALAGGTLNILDNARALTGSAVVGNSVGASGAVNVNGLGSNWTVNGLLTVGNVGNGLLGVASGGQVQAGSVVLNGQVASLATAKVTGARTRLDSDTLAVGGTRSAAIHMADSALVSSGIGIVGEGKGVGGTARVIGAGTQWVNTTNLVVGQEGNGQIEVMDLARLQSPAASVGQREGSVGQVQLTGGAHWQATNDAGTVGTLLVGEGGTGTVTLAGAASFTTLVTTIGDAVSSSGFQTRSNGAVVLGDAGTLWTTDKLTVGHQGDGSFAAASGSRLAARTATLGLAANGQGLLTASGAGTRIDIAQDLSVGFAGAGTVTVGSGAVLSVGAARLGELGSGSGTVRVEGAGALWTSLQTMVVGRYGSGSFAVLAGATATLPSLQLGQLSNGVGGSGSVVADGAGSGLSVAGDIVIGDGGFGKLTARDSGLVASGGMTRANAGGSVVLDGGTLRSAAVALGAEGRLDWRSGVLHVTGGTGVALDGTQLPMQLQLLPGRHLQVDHTLTLRGDSTLQLSGGSVRAGVVQLNQAILASTDSGAHALDMDLIGTLVGAGQVAATVRGGLGHVINAQGALTLGLLGKTDGFSFSGQLGVGAHQVLLLDRDFADLGTTTLLAGGELVTVNGARLGPGHRLSSSASSSIQGRFINGGRVDSNLGTLSFHDRVHGSGSFSGSVLFLAGYEPGDFAGSVTHADFGDGTVTFDPYATLALDIASTAPGNGFDRLENMHTLRLDGTLELRFGAGFDAAPGTVLSLLDFKAFGGSFNTSQVVVHGFDRARLDLSQLAIDGTVSVTAVPEPATLALWLGGLGAIWRVVRRRSA